MKPTRAFAVTGLAAIALTGCFNSSDSGGNQTSPPAMSVDFGTFVRSEFDNPDPNREPTKINGVSFSFNDQNNPQAFDDLLQ